MLSELKNRGIADALIVCCDGLRGLPDAIRVTWPDANRADVRRAHGPQQFGLRLEGELGSNHSTDASDLHRADHRGGRGPLRRVRRRLARHISGDDLVVGEQLGEFAPFLEFPAELRKIVYTTNAYRVVERAVPKSGPTSRALSERAGRTQGALPRGDAATEDRENMTGRTNGWKAILNALTVHYGDRITNVNR